MYADILRSIIGIEIFPVVSLVIFVAFFTGVLVRVAKMDRGHVERLSRLQLAGDGAASEEAPR